MQNSEARLRDAVEIALERARGLVNGIGLVGWGIVEVHDEYGRLKVVEPFANLITTFGDEYYAKRGGAGVSPAAPADVTKVSKMQLGTGTTAATKSGATTAKIETFIASSGVVFDASFPDFVDESGDTGWSIRYKTTWPAGTATNAAITEAVITTQTGANTASVLADTISRAVFTAVPKGASDSLALTWKHTFLGA